MELEELNEAQAFALTPEQVAERKKLHLEKYGVENPSQREEIKVKMKNIYIEKFGGYPSQFPEIKEKTTIDLENGSFVTLYPLLKKDDKI